MHVGKVLAASLLALLIAGPLSSLAIDSYSASYLIELYEKSRSELLTIIGGLEIAEAGANVTTNTTAEGNTTEVTTSTTTTSRCLYAQEEISSILEVADSYIEQAKSLLLTGNYKEAAKLALKALNTLGRAWIIVGQCFGSRVVEAVSVTNATVNASINTNVTTNATVNATINATVNATVNASKVAPGLLVAILRHEIRLARLNAIIAKAENTSLNVSAAKDLSDQAAQLLEEARAQALAGNTNAAAQLMAEANKLMAQIVKLLKMSSSNAIKTKKLEEIRMRIRNETAKPDHLIPPGLEKKEAWKGDKGKPGVGKPEVPPGKEKKEGKGKPESPGKGKKS